MNEERQYFSIKATKTEIECMAEALGDLMCWVRGYASANPGNPEGPHNIDVAGRQALNELKKQLKEISR